MAGGPYPTSLTDLQRLNHYEALGLTETSNSEAVAASLRKERWPWHLVEPEARQFATKRRLEAYAVINDPSARAEYDKAQGYTKKHLASLIGSNDSVWARGWIISFVVAALILMVGGGDATARSLGSTFAPEFEEYALYHEGDCTFPPCRGYYSREFSSSSGAWRWVLDRKFLLWFGPPLVLVTLAMVTRTGVARACGYAVATVRYSGRRDTVVSVGLFAPLAVLPILVLFYMWLVPPDAVPIPGG